MNRHERRSAAKKQKQQRLTPMQAFKLAIELHQQQRLEEAEKVYRSLLDLQPKHPDALHYYGVLLHQIGQSEQAIAYIKQALVIVPDYLDALNNLGNVLKETGDMQGAVDVYRQVLNLSPNHAGVHNNLGAVLRHLGAYQESISLLTKALALSPNNPDVLQNLGNSYRANGDYQQAIDAYRQSLAIKPQQKTIYQRLWRLLLATGQQEASQEVLKQWVAVDPNNHIAQHHFLAHTGYTPERASEDYIQETFDRFAASFDNVLDRLEYRAPSLVGQAVAKLFSESEKLACVLDAGCGTGLSGISLRAYTDKLIGVDLSQGMLNKAQQRKIYDELVKADLVKYLSSYTHLFNLIISADTLVYFGALEAFLQAASQALTTKGALVFTLEKHDAENGFQLNYHGRYAHTPRYVTDCLVNAGFELHVMETVILRKEMGEPVVGIVVTAICK
jgi:predicted TPR repeat methyltransferase